MIPTFRRNQHFRKVLVNKTFTHVQEHKKAMSLPPSAYIPSGVKSPQKFCLLTLSWNVDSAEK